MTFEVSPPRRAQARTAFVGALAAHTEAIRDVRTIRVSGAERAAERRAAERALDWYIEPWQREELPEGCADHLFDRAAVIDFAEALAVAQADPFGDVPDCVEGAIVEPSAEATDPFSVSHARMFNDLYSRLLDVASEARVAAVTAWSDRWNLSAPWLCTWAVYATLRWDSGRECRAARCRYGCDKARADDPVLALDLVLTPWAMLYLTEDRQPNATDGGDLVTSIALATGDWRPTWQRAVAPPLAGPHPQWETREQFLKRAGKAYDEARRMLEELGDTRDRLGRDLSAPRKLNEHCQWLARYQAGRETYRAILGAVEAGGEESKIRNAVKAMADLIDLPLRSRSSPGAHRI